MVKHKNKRTRIMLTTVAVLLAIPATILLVALAQASADGSSTQATKDNIMPQLDVEQLAAKAKELFEVKSIPKVYLSANSPITSKDNYLPMQMRITDDTLPENNRDTMSGEIKARGNSTLALGLKYGMIPYKIKLDEKTDLLGIGKHKKWCLIANFIDRSYVRQFTSYGLARLLRDDAYYQPKAKFVEVYLNNEYKGLYLLTEGVEEDDGALDIEVDLETHGDDVPFLLEVENVDSINEYYNPKTNEYLGLSFTDYLFYANSLADTPEWLKDNDPLNDEQYPAAMILKYPDGFSSVSKSQAENIKETVRSLYFGLENNEPLDQLNVDAASFVDSLIFCNLVMSISCKTGPSQYIYRDQYDLHIKAGPLWDFDFNMNGETSAKFLQSKFRQWQNIDDNPLFNGLLRNYSFVTTLINRYGDYYMDVLPVAGQHIKALKTNQILKAAVLRSEAKYNTWNRSLARPDSEDRDYHNPVVLSLKTYEDHVDYIYEWLYGDGAEQIGRIQYLYENRDTWLPYKK